MTATRIVHCDGWAHFTQNCDDLRRSFEALGIGARLRLLQPGVATAVEPPPAANPV